MITLLIVLGCIWAASVIFIGLFFLYHWYFDIPISEEYDGEDF